MGKETSSRTALVLFPGALGDAVCLEPAVAWLAAEGPVEVRARGAAAEVAQFFPCQPRIAGLDVAEVDRLFAPPGLESPDPSSWLGRYRRIVSFTGARSREFRERLSALPDAEVFSFPGPRGALHVVDEMLGRISHGAAPSGAIPRLRGPAPSGALPGVHGPAGECGFDRPPRLLLHPGSGGLRKRAPAALFVEVAERFRRGFGGEVHVVLGPAESDEGADWSPVADRLIQPDSVLDLARCIEAADVVLGNDAGPSHVAAALGAATVVSFQVGSPRRFGPRGPGVRLIEGDGGCAAPVERLWEAVVDALP